MIRVYAVNEAEAHFYDQDGSLIGWSRYLNGLSKPWELANASDEPVGYFATMEDLVGYIEDEEDDEIGFV
jgi:hypothetical protein